MATATNSTAQSLAMKDDSITISAIVIVAAILGDLLHEGVGHALLALLTGTQSGTLSSVAWSSPVDSRLVAAGGTLVNLAAGVLFWFSLRHAGSASMATKLFLLFSCAFNLFTGTGYFFFSGVTDFGDWAVVIANMHPHWVWRILLVVVGFAAYFGAVLIVGNGIVRYLGVAPGDRIRFRKLTVLPYFVAIATSAAAGVLNPLGMQLMWQSALPASAGANSGLLWMRYYIRAAAPPERERQRLERSYAWIGIATVAALLFIVGLGPGIELHR
jgi:hypothetical protein